MLFFVVHIINIYRKTASKVETHFNGFIFIKVMTFNLLCWTGSTLFVENKKHQLTMGLLSANFVFVMTLVCIIFYFFAPDYCQKQVRFFYSYRVLGLVVVALF